MAGFLGYPKSTLLSTVVDQNTVRGELNHLFIVDNPETAVVAVDLYKSLRAANSCMVLITDTPVEGSHVMHVAPYLPDDNQLLENLALELSRHPDVLRPALPTLRGLTVLQASAVTRVSDLYGDGLSHGVLVNIRAAVVGATSGVSLLGRRQIAYRPDEQLAEWVQWLLQAWFNPDPKMYRLRPRGSLLSGPPGTGKTSAADYVAGMLNLPLVRLNITEMLSKWQGEAEGALRRALAAVESLSPCVMLVDEVEKVFTQRGHDDTTSRMLGEFLWWLERHDKRVITLMTCNDMGTLPPELYREGRLDQIIAVRELSDMAELSHFINMICELYPGKVNQAGVLSAIVSRNPTGPWPQATVVRAVEKAVVLVK